MFCVDANVLIQANRLHYPEDVVPAFWEALAGAVEDEKIFVVHEVYREVVMGQDHAARWMKNRKSSIVRDERNDPKVIEELNQIDTALKGLKPGFKPAVVNEFYTGADPWVVAYCSAYGHTVVTQEVAEPLRRRKIKVPDVCAFPGVGVPCINTLELLRQLGVRMVLG